MRGVRRLSKIIFCFEGAQGADQRDHGRKRKKKKRTQVKRGDVIAIFARASHWWYNDGNEPLQIVSIADTLIINSGGGVTV